MMKILSIFAFVLLLFNTVSAQNKKDEIIKVWGNCEMCREKIEETAKSAGATAASWSEETKELKISFFSTKTSPEKIQKAIAKIGYDTQDFTGDHKAYSKLPACCQYDRKKTIDNEK